MSLAAKVATNSSTDGQRWTLLSSHGLVLCYMATHPDATIREIAQQLGVTERRIVDITSDLCEANLLETQRRGRRNHYELNPHSRFRHEIVSEIPVRDFVDLMVKRRYRRNGSKQPTDRRLAHLPAR